MLASLIRDVVPLPFGLCDPASPPARCLPAAHSLPTASSRADATLAPAAPAAPAPTRGIVLGRLLAGGGFARAYECRVHAAGVPAGVAYVAKVLTRDDSLVAFKHEHALLTRLQDCAHVVGCAHPLVPVLDPATATVRPCMLLRHGGACLHELIVHQIAWLERGEVERFRLNDEDDDDEFEDEVRSPPLSPCEAPLTPERKLHLLRQMLYAVSHLHSLGVCHRDLKPENMTVDEHHVLRLIDFGLATYAPAHGALLSDVVGSLGYAAPEILRKEHYNGFLADAWSLGVTAFALTFHYLPVERADVGDWRFRNLAEQQRQGAATVSSVLGWYAQGDRAATTCPLTVYMINALVVVDPRARSRAHMRLLVDDDVV